jgi:hypothetical protein
MFGYFNLSKQAFKGRLKKSIELEMMSRYTKEVLGEEAMKPPMALHQMLNNLPSQALMSPISQVFLYIGILIGVVFSNAVTQFSGGTEPKITINVVTVVISAIVALVIVPYVYQKLTVDPKSPFIVQFGFFVQHGIFWQVIMGAIGKAI